MTFESAYRLHLIDRLDETHGRINAARADLLRVIAEFERCEAYLASGARSMADWLCRFGFAESTALDYCRAARELALRDEAQAEAATAQTAVKGPLGTTYREADEAAAISEPDPHAIDPALVERGTRAHARIQNALATALRDAGIEPRSPLPSEPNFDLAWEREGDAFVSEVKSLTNTNETKQLRLGLGQVLSFRHVLRKSGRRTLAVLAVERRPSDPGWIELCEEVGVVLIWPSRFAEWVRASPI